MVTFIYKQEEINKEILILFRDTQFPGCCGARVFYDFNIKERNTNHEAPLSKELWAKVEKNSFYSALNNFFTYKSNRRKYITAPMPSKLNNKSQAYYHTMSTREPTLDLYTIMVKLKWTRSKSWYNPESSNTLVTFYKDK